ncbi:hypothetical protein [Cystobacter fuscus]|nr:hypothetical protein [Cystobacter fuscus]
MMTNPEEIANLWGHSALYLRRNGRVVRAVGFDPHRLGMAQDMVMQQVSSGRHPTQGYYYDERVIFRSPDALIVEFRVDTYHVDELERVVPRPGRAVNQNFLTQYVTRDGQRLASQHGQFNPSQIGNCINFIIQALTRSNLVVSASQQLTSRSTGRLTAAPGFDMSPAQGQLTGVMTQGFRNQTLVLHDLDSGMQLNPLQTRRLLSRGASFYRRAVGGITTLSVARLAGAYILPESMAPVWFYSDYAGLAKIIIDICIKVFPKGSSFWMRQPHVIDAILGALVKFCFIHAAMSVT